MPVCAAKNCGNIYEGKGKMKFFRFPTDESVKKIWMNVLRIKSLPPEADHSQIRICSAHFSQNQIVTINGRRHLTPNAVPMRTARRLGDIPDFIEPTKPINFQTKDNKQPQPPSFVIPKLICRICEDGSTRLTDLLLPTSNSVLRKFLYVSNVSFNVTDELPKFICQRCIAILDVAHEFKRQCELTHQKFQDMLQQLPDKGDGGGGGGVAVPVLKQELSEFLIVDNALDDGNEPSSAEFLLDYSDGDSDKEKPFPELQLKDFDNDYAPYVSSELIGLLPIKDESHPYDDIATNTTIALNIETIIDFPPEAVPFHMNEFVKNEKEYESVTDSDSGGDNQLHNQPKNILPATVSVVASAPLSYQCYICPWSKFKLKRNLLEHMRKKHSFAAQPKRFSCKYCSKTYSDMPGLYRHNSVVHLGRQSNSYKRTVVCEFCGQQFTFPANKHRHVLIVHRREKRYTCELCDAKFGQAAGLRRHILCKHNPNKPPPQMRAYVADKAAQMWPCDECPSVFKHKRNLARHQKTHKPGDGKRAPVKPRVRKARQSAANGAAPKAGPPRSDVPYWKRRAQCEVCGRSTLIVLMPTHMRIHNNERPYKCPDCDMAFATSSKMQIHNRIHTGARPYKCDCCDKTFRQKTHLRAHRIRVSGERAYKCSFCPKTFAFTFNLQLHERIHTGVKPYKCNLCPEKFSNSGALRKHAAVRHPDEADAAVTLTPKQQVPEKWL